MTIGKSPMSPSSEVAARQVDMASPERDVRRRSPSPSARRSLSRSPSWSIRSGHRSRSRSPLSPLAHPKRDSRKRERRYESDPYGRDHRDRSPLRSRRRADYNDYDYSPPRNLSSYGRYRDGRYDREPRPKRSKHYRDSYDDGTRSDDDEAAAERDARTVFVWQFSQRVDEREIFDLFSKAGRVRDVRLIVDRRSGRHKGQGYVEFYHTDSVPASLGLNGELIHGYPVAVKPILEQAAKRRPTTPDDGRSAEARHRQSPVPPYASTRRHTAPLAPHGRAGEQGYLRGAAERVRPLPDSPPPPPGAVQGLVSIEELAVLLNPHGLPVVKPPQLPVPTGPVPLPTPKPEQASGNFSLPESQQVPLPTPGVPKPLPQVPAAQQATNFTRLYIGSVPFTATEEDLTPIFKPFGEIVSLQLQREPGTGRSRGYGFVEYAQHESAKKALDVNGVILVDRALKVNLASATNAPPSVKPVSTSLHTNLGTLPSATSVADTAGELDEGRDGGLAMNASQRALLMQRLSRGTNMGGAKQNSTNPSNTANDELTLNQPCPTTDTASVCLLLSNMFDPVVEMRVNKNENFDLEVAEDVRDEVTAKYGTVKHLYVDKYSNGLVYIMFADQASAIKAKSALHGRWFGGKQISASYVDAAEYGKKLPLAPIPT